MYVATINHYLMEKKIFNYFQIKKKIDFSLKKKWFSSLNNLKNNTLCFLHETTDEDIKKINKRKNLILLLKKKNKKINKTIVQIETSDPKLIFFELLKKLYVPETINIKPKIGKNTFIGKNVDIGTNVTIGNNTTIHSNVVIGDNVTIGNNCVVKSGTVIGQKGFQAIKAKNGNLIEIFHIGKVEIKDNVDIGALNTIAKATLDTTFIDSYNKFDDHIHVAHNAIFKKNNIVCAGTIFGGSVKIGEKNFFGLNSTIRNFTKIGNSNFIGQGSNIVKNIGNSELVYGNPATKHKKI